MAQECFNDQGQYGAWETCPGYVKPYECSKGVTDCNTPGKFSDYRVPTDKTADWAFAAFINVSVVSLAWWIQYAERSWKFQWATNENLAWNTALLNSWLIWAPLFIFSALAQLTGANFAYAVVMFYVDISWVSILLYIAALVFSYLSWDNVSELTLRQTYIFDAAYLFLGGYSTVVQRTRAEYLEWYDDRKRGTIARSDYCNPETDIICWGDQLYEECVDKFTTEKDLNCVNKITDVCLVDEECSVRLNDYINSINAFHSDIDQDQNGVDFLIPVRM